MKNILVLFQCGTITNSEALDVAAKWNCHLSASSIWKLTRAQDFWRLLFPIVTELLQAQSLVVRLFCFQPESGNVGVKKIHLWKLSAHAVRLVSIKKEITFNWNVTSFLPLLTCSISRNISKSHSVFPSLLLQHKPAMQSILFARRESHWFSNSGWKMPLSKWQTALLSSTVAQIRCCCDYRLSRPYLSWNMMHYQLALVRNTVLRTGFCQQSSVSNSIYH